MNLEAFELQFLDYIEGQLSEADRLKLDQALEESAELRDSLASYKQLVQVEESLSKQTYELHPSFSVKVMDELFEQNVRSLSRVYAYLQQYRRVLISSVATFATLVLVVRFAWQTPVEFVAGSSKLQPIETNERELEESSADSLYTEIQPSRPPIVSNLTKPQSRVKDNIQSKSSPLSSPASADPLGAGVVVPKEISSEEVFDRAVKRESGPLGKSKVAAKEQQGLSIAEVGSEASTNRSAIQGASVILPENVAEPKLQKSIAASINTASDLASPVEFGANQKGTRDSVSGFFDRAGRPSGTSRLEEQESYIAAPEGRATLVREQAVSTFSIDVDTASYANIRRYLRQGSLPPRDAVRIEEMLNYFDYQYPIQREKPFTLSYELAPSPLEANKVLLKLGVRARDLQQEELPWNLVFLIDVSGSMSAENKLNLVKKTLPILVERMKPRDRISIVTYAGNAGVALGPTGAGEQFRILTAIENLQAGGGTNGSGGINLAYEVARRSFIKNGLNRVVLVTDGDFNVGVTSHQGLIQLIEKQRQSGIMLTSIGVGTGNLKDGMIERLADKGNGNYFYLDGLQEARKVFGADLTSNMEVVAKDVKLQIEFNPEQVYQYRLIGYENRSLGERDFNNDLVDAGEIGPGHTVTALYELVLNNDNSSIGEEARRYQQSDSFGNPQIVGQAGEKHGELAFLKIRYKNIGDDNSQLLQYVVKRSDMLSDSSRSSDDFRFAAAVSYFGRLLHSEAAQEYSYSDVAKLAQTAIGPDRQGYRKEFVELVKDAEMLAKRTGILNKQPLPEVMDH